MLHHQSPRSDQAHCHGARRRPTEARPIRIEWLVNIAHLARFDRDSFGNEFLTCDRRISSSLNQLRALLAQRRSNSSVALLSSSFDCKKSGPFGPPLLFGRGRAYWQRCRRPSSPRNTVPGSQHESVRIVGAVTHRRAGVIGVGIIVITGITVAITVSVSAQCGTGDDAGCDTGSEPAGAGSRRRDSYRRRTARRRTQHAAPPIPPPAKWAAPPPK